MNKPLLLLLLFFFLTKLAAAQDFEYANVTTQDMDMKNFKNDTSAHAVVLREYGRSRIDMTNNDNVRLIYDYHVRIKIFDSKAFDKGTITVRIYNNSDNDSYEDISDVSGVTFFKDDNGVPQQIELDTKKIYPVKEDKHYAYYKFTLPGIKNGSVIEYKYRITSPYISNFRSWQFQDDIPKIYSEYEVHIPAYWVFNASLRGGLRLTKNTSEVERHCFSIAGNQADCSLIVYGMGDIPALIEEENMTSPRNFQSAVNFELVTFTNPYTMVKTNYTKEWKDVDYQLKDDASFGKQMKRKSLLKDKIAPILAVKTDPLEKAQAIYAYLQKWFKWNGFSGIGSEGLGNALSSHNGSIADINLALFAALSAADLNTEAVILSTRDHGAVNTLYPVTNDFNYVVVKVNIGDKSYLLDASDPMLPFGMLPLKCLNDKGRVMSLDKPSYWINLSNTQRRAKTYTFDLTLQDDGKLKGTFVTYSTGYDAYEKRKAIKKFNTIDEYVENLEGSLRKFKILKTEITNLDSLNLPISEKYDVEINAFKSTENDHLVFSPYILNWITVNPYKLAERSYPVDIGMPTDTRLILTVHLPARYTLGSTPQDLSLGLPNNGGKFLTALQTDQGSFTFSNVIQLSKPVYGAEEYPYLKEFYNKIVQAEKTDLVFNKK